MRHARLIGILAVSASITVALFISSRLLHAQNSIQEAMSQGPAVTAAPPVYNPYPPGILPADLELRDSAGSTRN